MVRKNKGRINSKITYFLISVGVSYQIKLLKLTGCRKNAMGWEFLKILNGSDSLRSEDKNNKIYLDNFNNRFHLIKL